MLLLFNLNAGGGVMEMARLAERDRGMVYAFASLL